MSMRASAHATGAGANAARADAAATSLVVLALHSLPPHEAAAWRLAGADVHLCAADSAAAALQAARAQAAVLLLDGALANALPAALLDAALTSMPLAAVLPAPATRALEPDERVRAQLGVDPQALAAHADAQKVIG